MELRGSKTAKNLMAAFAGETQAHARYTMFAKVARTEGYIQVEQVFLETARNEFEHAKMFYKYLREQLDGQTVDIEASFPVAFGDTRANLKSAMGGENEEHTDMYREFARIAKEEGFEDISKSFTEVGEVEEHHEERFEKLLKNIENGTVFKKDHSVKWICQNCGYVHEGEEAPVACPACKHPQSYFKLLVEDY